jgi:hypothetical protein
MTASWSAEAEVNQRGAHSAERMPVERIESCVLNAVSSMRFGSSIVSRRSRTRRAMERLTLASRGWPPRLREAFTVGSGGVPSRSRMAARSQGTAAKSRLSTSSNRSGRGRWASSDRAAWLRTSSTRFCFCSSSGSMEAWS